MSPEQRDARQARWERRYRHAADGADATPAPAAVLAANRHLLPARGRALDLACGLGGSALLLAEHGLDSHAWDYAAGAVARVAATAEARGLPLGAAQRDVLAAPPEPASFEVIVVSRFLARPLCPAIAAALRPGGLLFYQTFTRERPVTTAASGGPKNRDFLLAPNELLQLFAGLRLIHYREDAGYGEPSRGERSEAWLVAAREEATHG